MFQLFIILFIDIVFCIMAFFVSNAVFVNPTLMSFLVINISTVFALIGNVQWNVTIADSTIFIVFIGFTMMLLAQIFAKKITRRFKYRKVKHCSEIVLKKSTTRMVIIFVIILTALYCLDILHVGVSLGSTGLSAIYAVKGNKSGTNFIIRQGVKIVMACAFVHIYFFVNNFIIMRKRTFDNFIHLIPAICGIICSIFTSIRTDILRILTAFLADYCILLFQTRNWQRKSTRKFIWKVLPVIIGAAAIMVAVRFIVKGETNATSQSYGFIRYITYYVGTPMVVLGSKLNSGIGQFKRELFGEITFNEAWGFIQKIGIAKDINLQRGSANVWIDKPKLITANVDTIFGAPLIDFGIIGMAIYIFILFCFLNRFYYRYIYHTDSEERRDGHIITYSYWATVASMSYYGNLMDMFISSYYIITLVLIVFYYKWIIKKNINRGT